MGEWKEYKIKEAPLEIIDGDRGKKYPSQDEFFQSGYCLFLSTKNVRQTGFYFSEPQFITIEKDNLLRKGKLERFDSILTTRGTVGNVAFYGNDVPYNNIRINSGMVIIRPSREQIDPKYCFYLFRSLQKSFETFTSGSAQPQLPIRDLNEMEILLPPLPEQKHIASILSSLDDKIDLLNRQNKTLEALAETLFRQWFVEEAEGNVEAKALEELIIFDPRERVSSNIQYSFFDMKCLSESTMTISDGIKRAVNSGSSFRNGDTLLAKITPCLENGKIGFVMNLEEDEIARGSTEFIVMRAKGEVSPYFVYCLARYVDFRNTAILSMTGTSGRQRVQTAVLKNYEINYSKKIMEKFHHFCHPHFLKIRQNQIQIRTLTRLRDTLLPKLMSGDVRVKDAERFVERNI